MTSPFQHSHHHSKSFRKYALLSLHLRSEIRRISLFVCSTGGSVIVLLLNKGHINKKMLSKMVRKEGQMHYFFFIYLVQLLQISI